MVVGTVLSSILSMGSKLVAAMNSSPSSSSSSGEMECFGSIKKALEKLEKRLLRIEAILADAEEREIHDKSVKLWLKELKYLAYEAEDVLEEYDYEIQRLEIAELCIDADCTPLKRKRERDEGDRVCDLTSALIRLSIPEKMVDISNRFDEISRDRVVLQLTENDGPRRPCFSATPQPTTSLVDESGIFGREDDKELLVEMLLSDELGKLSVIPIVGMGGLGKTTLAKVVYNDPRVQQHFNRKVWVCVSEDFDVARVNTEMVASITRGFGRHGSPDAVQALLKKELEGNKVLVVLDDVWNEKQTPWESFRVSFLTAEKVRFIVTTRNESVADLMQTVPAFCYRLGYLLEDPCYSLFRHHAFGSQDPDEQHPEELVAIGRSIVQKCQGLPLAIKTLGGLLHYEICEEGWKEILESNLWDLDEMKSEILPALMLSYQRMPAHLKPCFLYSSVFPKAYCFGEDKLVKLWMAQGYIQPRGNRRLEDIGSEYFHELRRRSFFQSAVDFDFSYIYASSNEEFVLHDTIHDLARSISAREQCAVILKHNVKVCPIPIEVRHLYVKCLKGATIDQMPLESARGLRTLIVENHFQNASMTNDHQYAHLGGLRALEMQHSTFPNSMSNLKHLRYLNGRNNNDGERLPPVGHLYNLQTLILTHKHTFVNCASDIKYLANLRHLILHVRGMKHFFATEFIAEHPDMFNAVSNNLSNSRCPRGICYASVSKLVEISLSGIIGWDSLSPLGQLQSLRSLTISLMHNIQRVGREFYCCGCVNSVNASIVTCTSIGFPFLEELIFSDMPEWKEWSGVTDKDFPRLHKLTLKSCPKLKGLPTGFLSLQALYVSSCEGIKSLFMNQGVGCGMELPIVTSVAWLHNLTSLRVLHVKYCSEFQLLPGEQLPSELRELHLAGCYKLELLPEQRLPSKLQELHLARCHKLQLSPEQQLPSGLETVHISDCWNLRSVSGIRNLTSLKSFKAKRCPHILVSLQEELPSNPQHVKITDCPRLRDWCQRHNFDCTQKLSLMEELCTSWSGKITEHFGVDNLTSLKKLFLRHMYESHLSLSERLPPSLQMLEVSCGRLESLSLDQNLPSLKSLVISGCHKLTSLIGLKNLTFLENLEIRECDELQFSPDEHLVPSLQSLQFSDCKGIRTLPLLHENLSALEKLEVSNCSELTNAAGICNLSALQTLIISRCPVLSISPDEPEQLSAMPSHVFISHCPALREWCGQQRIPYDESPFPTQETGGE